MCLVHLQVYSPAMRETQWIGIVCLPLWTACGGTSGTGATSTPPPPADAGTAADSAVPATADDAAAQAALEAGEVCFTDGDYECARTQFEGATIAPNATIRARAFSRLAWAQYQTDRGADAIHSLTEALLALDPPTDAEQRELRAQVIYDLPTVYVQAGNPAYAGDVFEIVLHPDEVVPALEALVENYAAMGFDEKARIVREEVRIRSAR
jgi:hypothetical protein